MKELLVLRHAKSSWKDKRLDDHDRPLNRRGRRDAPRMGRLILEQGLAPGRIISSTALRASTTARTVAKECGFRVPLHETDALYLSGPQGYVASVAALAGDVARVLVVGHNPDVEELVLGLTGRDETMPTAALAWIGLPIARWSELTLATPGELLAVWRPKEL